MDTLEFLQTQEGKDFCKFAATCGSSPNEMNKMESNVGFLLLSKEIEGVYSLTTKGSEKQNKWADEIKEKFFKGKGLLHLAKFFFKAAHRANISANLSSDKSLDETQEYVKALHNTILFLSAGQNPRGYIANRFNLFALIEQLAINEIK